MHWELKFLKTYRRGALSFPSQLQTDIDLNNNVYLIKLELGRGLVKSYYRWGELESQFSSAQFVLDAIGFVNGCGLGLNSVRYPGKIVPLRMTDITWETEKLCFLIHGLLFKIPADSLLRIHTHTCNGSSFPYFLLTLIFVSLLKLIYVEKLLVHC